MCYVRLRANIVVPELIVSQPKLEFGEVFAGFKKEITIQLINAKPVPCEWSTKNWVPASAKDRVRKAAVLKSKLTKSLLLSRICLK